MMDFQIRGWNIDPAPAANSPAQPRHPSRTHAYIAEGKNSCIFRCSGGHDRGGEREFASLLRSDTPTHSTNGFVRFPRHPYRRCIFARSQCKCAGGIRRTPTLHTKPRQAPSPTVFPKVLRICPGASPGFVRRSENSTRPATVC